MKIAKTILRTFLILFVVGIVLSVGGILYLTQDLPPLSSLKKYEPSIVSEVYDRNGSKIGEYYKERRYLIPYKDISPLVIEAFICAEDANFFHHKGLDLSSILRALVVNIKAREWKQGASTISQQVARSLFLTRKKTLIRKMKEMILASTMERYLSKEEILHLYLNQVFLGHGAYGIEAAARVYFQKNSKDLNLAEAALLAGLPQAPSHYSPKTRDPRAAKERQRYVLQQMVEHGYITQEKMNEAYHQNLPIREDFHYQEAPYFTEHVRQYLVEKYGENKVLEGGLQVYTTLNLNFQKAAQKSLTQGLREIDKRRGYRGALKKLLREEIETYLSDQHKNLVYEKYASRDIMKLPDGGFGIHFDPKHYEEPTPLEVSRLYDAVITEVNDDKDVIKIGIGNRRGNIPFDDAKWASPIDEEIHWTARLLSKPSTAFAVGDVIYVRASDEKKLFFSLEQEPEVQGAILTTEVGSGEILAMIGGYDFSKSQFNRAIQAERQVGSTFKPIVYAAALDKGFTIASVIQDAPIVYKDIERGHTWKPDNYGEKFYGETLFRTALIHSRNIPTIKIVQDIGLEYIFSYARRLGIRSPLNDDLSAALGSSSVTLLEMNQVFSVFVNQGKQIEPYFVKKVVDRYGTVLEENIEPRIYKEKVVVDFDKTRQFRSDNDRDQNRQKADEIRDFLIQYESSLPQGQSIPEDTAYLMVHLLEGVIQEGTGQKLKVLERSIAGKTGTTDNFEDAWFVGFSPEVITGVWVGMDDKRHSIGKFETGAAAAAPIWGSYMQEVLKAFPKKEFSIPSSISFTKIDPETGLLADPASSRSISAAFKQGTEPVEVPSVEEKSTQEPRLQSPAEEDPTIRGY
ncbi:MAG: PBP1A family penicillin-binding protein [Deltaproteobacteria bacterium]|nr:PBP1A family penicillin-binding protein [Deltaproteobacteria bacterium]